MLPLDIKRERSSNSFSRLRILFFALLFNILSNTCTNGFVPRSRTHLLSALGTCRNTKPSFCSIAGWDVSNVRDMSGMFQGAASFNGDISKWQLASLNNMENMFRNTRSFTQELCGSSWVNSNAVKTGMFAESSGSISRTVCTTSQASTKQVDTITLPGRKISSNEQLKTEVAEYLERFPSGDCSDCPQGAIGDWDVSRITDMSELFSGADLFKGDISKWDVSRVTNMKRMFMGAKSFDCDLSKWDVSKVADMSNMFTDAKLFKGDISKSKQASALSTGEEISPSPPRNVPLLGQTAAIAMDKDLMRSPGFSIFQLVELSGLSVASAVATVFPTGSRVFVVAGPNNNGADALTAARHLTHFGYKTTIWMPEPLSREPFASLMAQCNGLKIPRAESFLPADHPDQYDVVLDGLFGFSYDSSSAVRAPFAKVLDQMARTRVPVASIDVPSGWDVEKGDTAGRGMMPHLLISLAAPKLCAKFFTGPHHYMGGRFVPDWIIDKYDLHELPTYICTSQIVKLPSILQPILNGETEGVGE